MLDKACEIKKNLLRTDASQADTLRDTLILLAHQQGIAK